MSLKARLGTSMLAVALILIVGCRRSENVATIDPPSQETSSEAPETAPEIQWQLDIGTDGKVESVAFSPDGGTVAGGSFLEARLWAVSDGQLLRTIEQGHTAENLAFSPDGTLLAAGLSTGGVQLNLVADGSQLPQLHTGFNNRLAFSPDGQTLATGNRNGMVWLWHLESGEQLAELAPPTDAWITALAYAPDGEIVAAGHYDGTINLWTAADGVLLHTLESGGTTNGLSFSPDGQLLAVAGTHDEWDPVIAIWTASDGNFGASGVDRQTLSLSQEGRAVAFSPDGRWLAAGSSDGIMLWEMPDATLRVTLDHIAASEDTDWVTDLAFSPDSTLLAVGRWTGILELWQIGP